MQAYPKDQLHTSSLYGVHPPSSDMADATYQYQQYPSSFASSSARPSWSSNWENPQDASMYNNYTVPIHLYDGQPNVLPPRPFDTHYIPRSTSSSLAAAMTPYYPESAQRTVLPDPTRTSSCGTSYGSSDSSQSSPSSNSHYNSPVLAIAAQHSMAAAGSASRYAAPSITQNSNAVSTGMPTAPSGRTYADSHATATPSSAAASEAGPQARGVFHVDPFSSTSSKAGSAPMSVPVALKYEGASGLSPRVLAFSSKLEPLEDAEDPFPLRVEDLATRDEEELYRGLSHAFYVNTARAQSPRQSGPPGDVKASLHLAPWSAVKALSTSPSVSPVLSPRSSPSVLSELSDASSDMGPAYTTAPIASPPRRAPSGVKTKRKSKMHCCEECGKPFPRPSGLATHMNSHSGEKPFKCPLKDCPKMFTVRSNAKRHLRTHGIHLPSSRNPSLLHGADAGTIDFDAPVVSDVQYAPNMGPGGKLWKVKWMGQGASGGVRKATHAGEQYESEVARGRQQRFPNPAPGGALWDPGRVGTAEDQRRISQQWVM